MVQRCLAPRLHLHPKHTVLRPRSPLLGLQLAVTGLGHTAAPLGARAGGATGLRAVYAGQY